jgi:hypothetical protein
MLRHSSGLPSEQFYYLVEHALRLSTLEAYYRSQPSAETRLHRFGSQEIIKIPPPGLQTRGLRRRGYGIAGNSNPVHHVSVQYLTEGGALKRRVVRLQEGHYLDDASGPDVEFDSVSVPTDALHEDDSVLADALDTLGHTL